jgi:sortase (surface protein transpeptidase)
MDAGGVTWVTAPGADSLLASAPGARGTLWIAAHRSTHGAPFASVPDLADGAIVTVSDATATASYRVVARVLVQVRGDVVLDAAGTPTNAATLAAITRSDGGGDRAPRLLLQTCEGSTMRWMIYADLVAAS